MKADRGLTIERMVELGGVSRAGCYRFDGDQDRRPERDMDLRDAIQRVALEWPSYGRPRITAELRRRGWKVNPKRVYRAGPEHEIQHGFAADQVSRRAGFPCMNPLWTNAGHKLDFWANRPRFLEQNVGSPFC